jgi:hypothetical protein
VNSEQCENPSGVVSISCVWVESETAPKCKSRKETCEELSGNSKEWCETAGAAGDGAVCIFLESNEDIEPENECRDAV